MAFAVSYKDNEETKRQVEELITQGGGRILKDGFNELFVLPSFLSAASTESAMTINTDASNEGLLRLTLTAQQIGFTCLITDEHSRRAKYMQALALNIPCLSGRWIKDCVVKNRILDWEPYLLPSGESKFLDGAVRSRILVPNPAPTARLPDTIAGRPKLLAGQSVLVVMDRGKVAEQRRAYVFLTYALGSRKVGHVQDLKVASECLRRGHETTSDEVGQADDHGWDWIYVGDQRAAATARKLFTDMSNSSSEKKHSRHRKKRKSGVDVAFGHDGGNIGDLIVNGKRTRILDNDFVCQSLILGKLFEER
jgi:DNA repair protein RAD9